QADKLAALLNPGPRVEFIRHFPRAPSSQQVFVAPAEAGVQGGCRGLVALDSPLTRQGCPGKIWSHAKPVLVSYRTMQQSSWPGLSRPSTSFDAGKRRRGCADQVRARRL